MNASIHSNHHTEERDPTTDEIKRKRRTTSTLLIPGCQPGTHPMIDEEEEAEELQMEQASLSCQIIGLPVPAPVVVVNCEPRGLSNLITKGYQN
jgi:hypothetical protein